MLRLRLLPNFKLANADGHEKSFEDFLVQYNVVIVDHSAYGAHAPSDEMLRSFLAEGRGVEGVSVRGINIRSDDAFCDQCCGPHVVLEGRNLVTVCDSDGLIRRLWGVGSDSWILIVNAARCVLEDGPVAEVERLVMQFSLDLALPAHRIARAPPGCRHGGRNDTAA